jgi:hypothetical protein
MVFAESYKQVFGHSAISQAALDKEGNFYCSSARQIGMPATIAHLPGGTEAQKADWANFVTAALTIYCPDVL